MPHELKHYHSEEYILSTMEQWSCNRDVAIEILNELDNINLALECIDYTNTYVN